MVIIIGIGIKWKVVKVVRRYFEVYSDSGSFDDFWLVVDLMVVSFFVIYSLIFILIDICLMIIEFFFFSFYCIVC